MVVELARDPEALERQHDLGAQVVQRVVGGRREVPALLAHGVAEARRARVPVALRRVDAVVRLVRRELVGDLVEDEELALGAEVRRVGDPRLAEVLLRPPRDSPRVAPVGLAGRRVGDLAHERQGRRLGEGVEHRARRVGHEQEVALGDALPAADRRAVEAQPLRERGRAERADGQRHVLPGSEQVRELEVDHLGLLLERPGDRLLRLRLRAVREVCLRLHLLHAASFWSTKKAPAVESTSEAPSPSTGRRRRRLAPLTIARTLDGSQGRRYPRRQRAIQQSLRHQVSRSPF